MIASPSNGEPKQHEITTSSTAPDVAERIAAMPSNACSIDWWMFFSLYAGDADTVIVRWSTPAAVASSAPLTLGTSAHSVTSSAWPSSAATTSAAPAIAGTALGLTNEATSMSLRPASIRALDQLDPLVGSDRLLALQAVTGHDVADPHPRHNRWVSS